MKRWIAMGICTVLILVSGMIRSRRNGIAVGRGSGRSEKIETIEKFFDFAEFFSSREKSDLVPVALTIGEDREKTESEYRSLTFTEVSSISNNGVKFQRELTGYMTEDAVLYHFEGSFSISIHNPSNS